MASANVTKLYLTGIKHLQTILLTVSIATMLLLPLYIVFSKGGVSNAGMTALYTTSLAAVFFVMAIRPLADIFSKQSWIRALVILRKGFGVLSASIIMAFFFGKVIDSGFAYLATMATSAYWSLSHSALFAHLGDLSAIPLLITSNKFSKRILGAWWARIQKLAYVYFYSGALYELIALHSTFALVAIIVVTVLVLVAFIKNHSPQPQTI